MEGHGKQSAYLSPVPSVSGHDPCQESQKGADTSTFFENEDHTPTVEIRFPGEEVLKGSGCL